MRKLTTTDTSLKWVQPDANKRSFELQSGNGDLIATLAWEKPFGTLATAQAAEGTWSFKRVGFFNNRVTIRTPGSESDLAVFRPGWGYEGTLESPGRTYRWKNIKFFGGKWGFLGPDGAEYVSFEYTGGMDSLLKIQGSVSLLPGAPVGRDMPLLLALGWYIMVRCMTTARRQWWRLQ
jgi:hypothetical protein